MTIRLSKQVLVQPGLGLVGKIERCLITLNAVFEHPVSLHLAGVGDCSALDYLPDNIQISLGLLVS